MSPFFSDSAGLPNSSIYVDTIPPSSGYTDPNIVIDLVDTVNLSTGTYWLSIVPIMPFNGNAGRWFWDRTTDTVGNQYHLIDEANLFGAGLTAWTPGSFFSSSLLNLSFRIFGTGGDTTVADLQNFDIEISDENAIQLSWDTSPAEFYILQKGTAANMLNEFLLLDNPANSVDTYIDLYDDQLAPNTWYYYSIQARYGQGISGTLIDSVLTLPDAAIALAASNISDESFTAKWDLLSTENYVIDVAKDSAFTDLIVSSQTIVGSSVDSFMVSGLEANTMYYYRVVGENAAGQGEYSDVVMVLTLPAAPVALDATMIGETSFQANWELTSTDHFLLDVARDMNFSDLVISDSMIANSLIDSLLVDGLEANTTYYYRVSGANASGEGEYSNVAEALTLPAAPVALDASEIEATSFQANWELLSTDDYLLDISRNMDFSDLVMSDVLISDSLESSYIVSGLDANTTYYYRLSAANATGEGAYSNVVMVLTLPAAPVALVATEIDVTSFQANWELLNTDDYVIDVARDMAFTDVVVSNSVIADSSEVSFMVSSLTANTTYYYRLSGANATGQGEFSNIIAVTTKDNPTGLSDQLAIHTDVWPNPMTNVVNLTLNRPKAGEVHIRLVNQKGQVVREQEVRKTSAQLSASLEVDDLPRGMYILTISMDNWSESVKLVK